MNAWVPVFASSRCTPCASLGNNSLSSCRNRDEGIIRVDWGSAGCIVVCARPINRRKSKYIFFQLSIDGFVKYACTFCKSTRQIEFDTKASVDQRMEETSKESGQHFWLFPIAFDKICFRSEDILFEDRIERLFFNFCCKKLKICVIISTIIF